MVAPPTGTVTFLFTDVEGSTRQAQADPVAWEVARARHHEIVRGAIEGHHGLVFRDVGDAFCAAFATVGSGVAAALAAQRGLRSEPWPARIVKARMGLHTGAAEWQAGDYEGYVTLARAQRIMAVANGGQVLLSGSAAELALADLPPDVALRDLGEHRLKDLAQPERVYQLVATDLPTNFPPLATLDGLPHNLPTQLTSFIGRERELAELKPLLASIRLLTLTGPGGTGKTRLALQLASEVLETFGDGAWLTELAPLSDPALLDQSVAATLGVREQPGRPIQEVLTDYVRSKDILLILDNCEHLIGSCAQLADSLLRAAPAAKILTTSRESLGLAGETAFQVPSLPVPDPTAFADPDRLVQNDCVRLFVDRASAADPRFQLTKRNGAAVAEICRRLDGIPLAIELAAARIRVFPPEQIAAHLDDRFRLLTGGSRTALERHQTLVALIDWSHDLLTEPERVLLRRLSVFAGGWSLEAAEAVCNHALGEGLLETMAHLADKSMVVVEGSAEAAEGRYRLLETIRQYARDRLLASGESGEIRDRHLEFFLRFAEAAEPKLRSADQFDWLNRVEMEHDNLRTALAWALESGQRERALEGAGALGYFWELRGYVSEGSRWLDAALALRPPERGGTHAEKARRAKALYAAGRIRFMSEFEPAASRSIVEESLELWRELGDKWWAAVALEHVGFMLMVEDTQLARARLEEGVSLARQVEDRWPLALCLLRLAGAFGTDNAGARGVREEGVAVARGVGDRGVLSQGLIGLVTDHLLERDFARAEPIAEEALAEARAIGDFVRQMLALLQAVEISCYQGLPGKAKDFCYQALALARGTGSPQWLMLALLAFGFADSFGGQPSRGARLLVTAQRLLQQRGIEMSAQGERDVLALRQMLVDARQLDPAAFDAAVQEGPSLTLEEALELATAD